MRRNASNDVSDLALRPRRIRSNDVGRGRRVRATMLSSQHAPTHGVWLVSAGTDLNRYIPWLEGPLACAAFVCCGNG